MLGTMRLVVLRAFPLVKGYGSNLAVKCDGVLAFVEAQYNLALCSRAARTRSVRGSIPVALPTSVSTRPDNAFLRVMSAPGDRNLSISISIRGLPIKARSGERTTRSASASPRHGSAARRARSMPIRPRRRRPIRCDRAKRLLEVSYQFQSPAGGSCSPISSTLQSGRRHSQPPTPRRGGSAMPQCSG